MADKTAIMKEAQKHLARGQLDKAIAELEKLIRESPDGNTYNMVGDLCLKKGDRKNAIDSFHKAAGYFRQEGFSLKALALYKKVLNISQTDASALYALGELSEEKGLATDATKYYLAAADSLSKEGKKERLLDVYQKILSLSPSNITLRNKVAEIFLKEGLTSDAVSEYLSVAKTYEEKGDIEKAREYYGKIVGIQPRNKEAAIGMSQLLQKSGDVGGAVTAIREAASLFPDDIDVLFRYAELSLTVGDDETSENCLLKIQDIDPDNTTSKKLLCELHLKKGLKEKAWEEYLPVIDEMILQENYEEPVRLLELFRDVDPLETGRRLVSLHRQKGNLGSVAAELGALGDALKEQGRNDEALDRYREALEVNPGDVRVRELIEELERKPDEEAPEAGKTEPEEEVGVAAAEGERSEEEVLAEADLFLRYGLLSEALKALEGLKLRSPQNADIHARLKTLYVKTSDRESAVTECLILNELFKRQGDLQEAEKVLREAAEICPEDPRLAERGVLPQIERTSYATESTGFGGSGLEEPDIEDYEEEIAEADFYIKQGLTQEASKILERLHALFPENREVADRLTNLGQLSEAEEVPELQSPLDTGETLEEEPAGEAAGMGEEMPGLDPPRTGEPRSEEQMPAGQPSEEGGFEEFTFSEEDLVDAQEMPEPALDNDVLEVFQEFKKGLEKELGEGDSETHYNLGIAYKEMGLIDDAITEFQTSRSDPKRFMQSSTMLAVCYMEKGMYTLVIDVLRNVLEKLGDQDESCWPVKYDLAEAYEKNDNPAEALRLYTEVFGWDAKFRAVAEKVSQLGEQTVKSIESEKPKTKKNRVSYL